MNHWQKLILRINERTIKNPRLGAVDLILETDVWPFEITGQLDTSRWTETDIHGSPVRVCDAQAWFVSTEFAESGAKENDRLIYPDPDGLADDESYIILSAEQKPDKTTHVLLRKYTET